MFFVESVTPVSSPPITPPIQPRVPDRDDAIVG
jgi:hypothetical protein